MFSKCNLDIRRESYGLENAEILEAQAFPSHFPGNKNFLGNSRPWFPIEHPWCSTYCWALIPLTLYTQLRAQKSIALSVLFCVLAWFWLRLYFAIFSNCLRLSIGTKVGWECWYRFVRCQVPCLCCLCWIFLAEIRCFYWVDFFPALIQGVFFYRLLLPLGVTRGWPHLHLKVYTLTVVTCLLEYLSWGDPERFTFYNCYRRISLPPFSRGSLSHRINQ